MHLALWFFIAWLLLGTSGIAAQDPPTRSAPPFVDSRTLLLASPGKIGRDSCSQSGRIGDLPSGKTGSTCGASNSVGSYGGSCTIHGVAYPGPNVVYEITLTAGNSVGFNLDVSGSCGDLMLALVGQCDNGSSCVINSVDFIGAGIGPEVIPETNYPPGTYYLYIDSFYPIGEPPAGCSPSCGSYALSVTGINFPEPDLMLEQSESADPVAAGDSLTYTLKVTNDSPFRATGVVLTDTLPADGVSLASAPGGVQSSADTVTFDLGELAPSASATRTLTLSVDPAFTGVLINRARVQANEPDPNPSNSQVSEQTGVRQVADLALATQESRDPVAAGEELTYTLTVTNDGPSDASGIVLTDTIPAEVSFESASSGCGRSGTEIRCTLSDLAAGASASRSIRVSLDAALDPAVTPTLTNTASVSASEHDPDLSDNTDTEITGVVRRADLAIAKAASADRVVAGTDLSYTLTVLNTGPSDSTAGLVSDILQPGLSFAASADGCTATNGTVTCPFDAIASGETVVLSFDVDVASSVTQSISNSATAIGNEDPNPANDTSDPVVTGVDVLSDLSVEKTDSPDPVIAGETLTYTLAVENLGPSDSSGGLVTDSLPSDLTFVSSQDDCSAAGNEVTCSFNNLPASGSISFDFAVAVGSSILDSISNTATVTGNEPDPVPANNSDDEDTLVMVEVELSLDKSASPDPVTAGQLLIYTLTVTNDGPSDAIDVTLTDVVPDDTTYVSATPISAGWSLTTAPEPGGTGEIVFANDSMTGGATASFVIVVRVELDTPDGFISNDATADCTICDPVSVSIQTTVHALNPTLTVTKTGSGDGLVTSEPAGIDCGDDCDAVFTGGTVVALTATPDPGSVFEGWTGDPDCDDGALTMDADKTCNAIFSPFTLTVTKNGNGTVTSEPPGIDCGDDCTQTYDSGTVVTLTATPDPGSTFDGWTGNPDCEDGVITMDADKTCTAIFGPFTLTVTKEGSGNGTVTSDPPGIDCGTDCIEIYDSGTRVTLTPTPDPGSTFVGWAGGSDCADGIVTMNKDKNCIAIFGPFTLTVTQDGGGDGTITSDPPGIDCGADCSALFPSATVVTLNATPDPGSTFEGWTGDPDCEDGAVTMDADKTCTAIFGPFTLTVTKDGGGDGTVTSEPPGIDCGADCNALFPSATVVTLTATPDADSTFDGWSGDPDCEDGAVTVDADKTCTAHFEPRFTLTVAIAGTGNASVTSDPAGIDCPGDCVAVYDSGEIVDLTATPTPAHAATFDGWSGDPDCADGSVTMDADTTCSANFVSFELTVVRVPLGADGTVVSDQPGIDCGTDCTAPYARDLPVTLSAVDLDPPGANVTWTEDCAPDGFLIMDADKTCIATFRLTVPPEACIIPPVSLTTWLPFDTFSDAIAADIAGARNGRLIDGPVAAAGRVDRALSFDGAGGHVEIPDLSSGASPTGDFSIAVWLKTEGSADPDQTTMSLIDNRETADPVHGTRLYLEDGALGLQLSDARFATDLFVADGEWHFVAVTVDRDDPTGGRWYLDGVEVASFDPTAVTGSLESSAPLRIGRGSFDDPALSDPGAHFTGSLDELQIFDRTLAGDEIPSIFEAGSAGVCKETFYLAPDTPVCAGAAAGTGRLAICNYATRDHLYWLTFAGLPAAECDADVDGPVDFELLSPDSQLVRVAPESCRPVRFRAARPDGMTGAGLRACYRAEVRNVVTGFTAFRTASLWDSPSWCAVPEGEVPLGLLPGEIREVAFEIANTGDAASTVQVEMQPATDKIPGSSALGLRPIEEPAAAWRASIVDQVLIPAGGSARISAEATLGETRLLEAHDLVLRESTTSHVLASTGLRSMASRPDILQLHRGRFRVEVEWRDFAGATGAGRVAPASSDDSGLFWFFSPDNWEMLVKVVDGCGVNGHLWVLAAATTNVEYTLRVTDTHDGSSRSYSNPLGNAAATIVDPSAFAACADIGHPDDAAEPPSMPEPGSPDVVTSTTGLATPEPDGCSPTATRLCLGGGRFSVEVAWQATSGDSGPGQVAPVGSDISGLFSFVDPDHWEMLVKVFDRCAPDGRVWVFAAATTDAGYTLRVTDTRTGVFKEYSNLPGNAAGAIIDTDALGTCH